MVKKSLQEEEKESKRTKTRRKKIKLYKEWVKMARRKRKEKFERQAQKWRNMWRGHRPPWIGDDDMVSVNLVNPNIEITKSSIFFKNPRAFVKATQETFILENGEQLDGTKAARLLEDGVNYVAYDIKLKRTIRQVRDDALQLSYGVIMVGYEADFGIDESDKLYVKDDSIYAVRVSPFDFLADPESTDSFTFSDARWLCREYEIRLTDFRESGYYENTEEIKSDKIGYGEEIYDSKRKSKRALIDYTSDFFREHPDSQKITLYEMWIRPSAKERRKLKKGEPGGRVVVFSMQSKDPHKYDKWPYRIKGFPFRGLAFFKDNDDFYPIHDATIYEKQLEEKDKMRTYILEAVKTYGQRKIVVNVDGFDSEEEIDKLTDPEAGPIIKVFGDVEKVVKAIQFGSVPAELFMADKKIDEDIDKISGISDLKRGLPPVGVDTATEVKEISRGGAGRFTEKRDVMGEFYAEIARLIIQLIKQYWTTERVVRRLGTLTPEWSDSFSTKDIQIEDDVEVDIGEMLPVDEVINKKFALDMLELAARGVENQAVREKLATEGYKINMSEAVKEVLLAMNIKNDKLLQRLDPEEYLKILKELFQKQMTTKASAGGGSRRTSRGGSRRRKGVPTYASELGRASRTSGVPKGAPSAV